MGGGANEYFKSYQTDVLGYLLRIHEIYSPHARTFTTRA